MNAEPKSERVTIMMAPSDVKAVDDWSFANRVRSRGEAIRRLVQLGLASAPKPAGERPDAKA
jgi:hypothetical protein